MMQGTELDRSIERGQRTRNAELIKAIEKESAQHDDLMWSITDDCVKHRMFEKQFYLAQAVKNLREIDEICRSNMELMAK